MEVSYRRDLNRNYMTMEIENVTGNEYPIRMLEQNAIPEFLPFQLRKMNGKLYYYYEITSRQTLRQVYETVNIKSREMEQLLTGIGNGIEHAQQYLLSGTDLLLDPEYIYFNIETGQVHLCFVPFSEEVNRNSFLILAEFILKKLDHGDRRAVELGYELFGQASQEHFSLQESLKLLLKEKKEPTETAKWSEDADEILGEERQDAEELFEDFLEEEEQESRGKNFGRKRKKAGKAKEKPQKEKWQKETWQKERRQNGKVHWRMIGICAAAISIVSLLFAGIVYFARLDLTQTGGLAFLFLAVIWIIYSIVESRKEKNKKKHWLEEEVPEEDEFAERLLENLYWEEGRSEYGTAHKTGNKTGYRRDDNWESDSDDICGETKCLTEMNAGVSLRLVSLLRGEYPDIRIDQDKMILGKKREQVTICLHQDCISRIHAKIEKRKDQYFITDLNSTNGTFVNGERLLPNEQRRILPGDKINLATLRYVVKE